MKLIREVIKLLDENKNNPWTFSVIGNLFITLPLLIIGALYVNIFVIPKDEEERLQHRKNFIEDVSFSKQLVIGKKEVGDYSKSYLIEYQDTFILEKEDDLVENLYKTVEKGDIVEKKKGADYYIVTRDDSTFNVKF